LNTNKKIVVTGMGAVTPIGIGVSTFWNNLIAGVSGVRPITRFDTTHLPVRFAGQVEGFDADALIPKAYSKNLSLFGQFAFAAAQEAIQMSAQEIDPFRTGLVMGTAMDGIAEIAETQTEYDSSERKKVSPRFVPRILGNMAPCQIAIANNIRGPSLTVNTACSSGIDAINVACMLIHSGAADTMVAVGGEAILCAINIASLSSAQALSKNNDDPAHACRPFDLHRDGFVMGEGGGALVLETEEHAKARGAVIYAEVLACANNNDAYHITSPRPGGEGGAQCMMLALEQAGLKPEDVDYINTHGTATPKGDAYECAAIRTVFGDHAQQLAISSTKGATGHLMGAGGIIETIACIQAIREGVLPPTLNFETPDPECDLDCVPNTARKATVNIAMNNALGFGGQNASLILGRYNG
jgi:3-oxoacyl-[acyl-carrier-protein] synthase II